MLEIADKLGENVNLEFKEHNCCRNFVGTFITICTDFLTFWILLFELTVKKLVYFGSGI